jgi:hypothetical protein
MSVDAKQDKTKMAETTESKDQEQPWFLQSKESVLFPDHPAFQMSNEEFMAFVRKDIKDALAAKADEIEIDSGEKDAEDSFTMVSDPSTTAGVKDAMKKLEVDDKTEGVANEEGKSAKSGSDHPFVAALHSHGKQEEENLPGMENKMLTENADVAYRSTTNPLVDLFSELEEVVSGPRLLELLNAAWVHDPLATLKIIFNARSIHLGKSSRTVFYKCAGWLAQYHPLTLILNLQWLERPVIEKKVQKKEGSADDDMVLVEAEKAEHDETRHDIRNGVSHGYWKDLLNILALAVNEKLNVLSNPADILNVHPDKAVKTVTAEEAKVKRHQVKDERHERAVAKFNTDPVYRGLHIAVTRLFVDALKKDLAALHGDDAKAKRQISLAAKWAPTRKNFHDRHTFVTTSIAEQLNPLPNLKANLEEDESLVGDEKKRDVYIRHVRDEYRKSMSALRAHLDVVEQLITANKFSEIKYERVPSKAMSMYTKMFATKDMEHFGEYIDKVASGKARISGATLLPSTLVNAVRTAPYSSRGIATGGKANTKRLVEDKIKAMQVQVVDEQWKTLVQRIKDSGTMENCMAVCDVSGSMSGPVFPDRTCPMDSSIGLSLLVAEVCKAPFGGTFITFSDSPKVVQLDLEKSFSEKIRLMENDPDWSMSTDFVAVFEKLILPLALKYKIKQEDMVKRLFVFSDMQFNAADHGRGSNSWTSSYERISKLYKEHGYEMPELVFWNLAGGRAGYGGYGGGDPVAPKPVTTDEVGTALVSGYSQGMLKVFLDSGSFEEEEEEEEVKVEEGDDGEAVVEKVVKKQKIDPLSTVKKAISHKAYEMLKVLD